MYVIFIVLVVVILHQIKLSPLLFYSGVESPPPVLFNKAVSFNFNIIST